MTDRSSEARALVEDLAPLGAPVVWRDPLEPDEATWFVATVRAGVVSFRDCDEQCFRYKKWGVAGPDHFDTPDGRPRHLYSKPGDTTAWLNREYLPHVAAYGRAVLDYGYRREASSFSRYRTFSRDLVSKRAGGGYETDAEFYDAEGRIWLQVEAKKDPKSTARLVASIEAARQLSRLPAGAAKELEYVLDLAPRFLWVVGPGSIDPARHVYAVEVAGLDAAFEPVDDLPSPAT